jgi:hypothetical protein
MLRSLKELRDYILAAKDGHIGRTRDFLFDDTAWTIRYMVADTGTWLPRKKVLISPVSLGQPDWKSHLFQVTLTKKQIEKSPPLESDAPVSQEYERRWHEYYNWSPYWYGGGIWGAGPLPQGLIEGARPKGDKPAVVEAPAHNLRSTTEVMGYHIQAKDGEIGHVEDFIVDDASWAIRYMAVDTRNWIPGKKVLVAPTWITDIEWAEGKVHVDLTRKLMKNGPEYDPRTLVNREYEIRLYDYYGRPKYWE